MGSVQTKIKRILTSLSAVVAILGFICGTLPQTAFAAATTSSAAVPMYQYPTVGTYWSDINGAGSSTVPFEIVNPASGPGVSVDPNYTSALASNKAAGIRSIGYVDTGYQTVNYATAFQDIDEWYQMYPDVGGIFIDQIQDINANDLCYVAGLYNHVKNNHPNDLVVINPGTHISQRFEPYSDIFMNAENTFAAYQSGWSIQYPGWEDNPAYTNRFWHLIHTTSSGNYATALSLARANNAGWVYITDDTLPNPYDVTPSYWNTEISDINSLPDTTIPNRGKTTLPAGCQDLTVATSNSNTTSAKQVKTTSAITVTNSDAAYNAEPTTRVSFALPAGVTLSGAGSNWSCSGSQCSYNATINASQSASVLSAEFTTSCDYDSGDITGTLTNFAGNTDTFTVGLTKPTDCTLADTGLPIGTMGIIAGAVGAGAIAAYVTRTRVHYVYERSRRRSRW